MLLFLAKSYLPVRPEFIRQLSEKGFLGEEIFAKNGAELIPTNIRIMVFRKFVGLLNKIYGRGKQKGNQGAGKI